MNGTPRLRSAYPATPQSTQRRDGQTSSASGSWASPSVLPVLNTIGTNVDGPLIPLRLLDAPSQRLYIAFFYIGLTVWRLYDFLSVLSDEADSLWLFMKWVLIDSIVLYGLPGLRIPWLQWSSSTMTLLFVSHGVLNAMMMFRIPIPLQAWLFSLIRLLYDRELAVLERNVKPGSVLQNASLILGKQIIHILPEGSAMLNPNKSSFCIGSSHDSVALPISVNQTNPVIIELIRIDIEANKNETIAVTGKELGKLKRHASKEFGKSDQGILSILRVPVKKVGLYRLSKVIDQTNLEVSRKEYDTLVVQCPSASIETVILDKCKGDLSDFSINVVGSPPLRIKYSKTINGKDAGHHVLEQISPEHPDLLTVEEGKSGTLVNTSSRPGTDFSWARTQSVQVPINESLALCGHYRYSIDEVQDACGNIVTSRSPYMSAPQRGKTGDGKALEQLFKVHARPQISFHGCNAQHELKVERGKARELPLRISSTDSGSLGDSLHTLVYSFLPTSDDRIHREQADEATIKELLIKPSDPGPEVIEAGSYSIRTINNEFCTGEVLEPSTCLLTNPPEPSITVTHETIPGKCVGQPVGLVAELQLTGTPPFRVYYAASHNGGKVMPDIKQIDQVHDHIQFRPSVAGHYIYTFTHISDAVYTNPRSITGDSLTIEQDIKPPASARIIASHSDRKVCIEEPASFDVEFVGGGSLDLEYELVYNGKNGRGPKQTFKGDGGKVHTITTERLNRGGQYTFALLSITDKSACKNPLDQEVKLDVGLQKPRISFGLIENRRTVTALEGKRVTLPVRLQGISPWYFYYRNRDDPDNAVHVVLHNQNDAFEVTRAGTYEIMNVHDAACPGFVDGTANQFEVEWVSRPAIHVSQGATIRLVDHKYVKNDICEGDEDATEVTFTGTPPFHVIYDQRLKPDHGPQSTSSRSINAALNSAVLRMETSNPGLHEYEFVKLGDYSYKHDPRKFTPITIVQRVMPKPSARFTSPGKTYKYCKDEEAGDEVIPISLIGVPPFQLEIEIKHHAITKPEVVNAPHIETNQYNFRIPHRVLALGTHAVAIRKVMDSRGCQRRMDFNAPHVQVSVPDVPTISPVEAQMDYCVGDRISYTLSGVPPFKVFYSFQGYNRKASIASTDFRRLAEKPGDFVITSISDQRSTEACKARVDITKVVHEMPSVRVNKGKTATAEIHEGSDAEILFEFGGTPPFEFVYTRSTNVPKGKKSEVIETKSEISHEYSKTVRASDEGIYEVVSIKDRYCSFSRQKAHGKTGQKSLMYL